MKPDPTAVAIEIRSLLSSVEVPAGFIERVKQLLINTYAKPVVSVSDESILMILAAHSKPMAALEISDGLGLNGSREVNLAIKRLVSKGWVAKEGSRIHRGRRYATFMITDAGRDHLMQQWIAHPAKTNAIQ